MRGLITILPLLLLVGAIPAPDRGEYCNWKTKTRRPRPTTTTALGQQLGSTPKSSSSTISVTTRTTTSTTSKSFTTTTTSKSTATTTSKSAATTTTATPSSATLPPPSSSLTTTTSASTTKTTTIATTVPAPTSGVSPIGLAMNWQSKADIASFGGNIGWYYSWNTDPLPNTSGLEFVPMIWGADAARKFDGTLPSGTKHILSFNEPDIGGQYGGSNFGATEAAMLHKGWTSKLTQNVLIGTPAVARGGKKWLQDWLAACGGECKYDFIPYHFYGTSAADFISYTKDFYATFGSSKKLWITEWACHDYATNTVCNKDQVKAFMNTAITWFRSEEGKKIVERWSWFGAFPNHALTNANGILETNGKANEVGKYYGSL